jgi:hypothetical protein
MLKKSCKLIVFRKNETQLRYLDNSNCVNIPYLLVILPGLSRSISSLVSLCGVLGSANVCSAPFFLGCLLFLQVVK